MNKSAATLKERLADWTSVDIAMHSVGVCLGFWRDFGAPPGEDPWGDTKHVFWGDDTIGKALYDFLDSLHKDGMLEYDAVQMKFRWNKQYKGSWE